MPWVQSLVVSPSTIISSDAFISAVHVVLMSLHMAFTVLSALTPKIDRARASKSDMFLFAVSKHWAVNVVQERRTCSSLASWASFICARASSINASHTYVEMSWQFSIAGSRYTFLDCKNNTNLSLPDALVHVSSGAGRVINVFKFAKFSVKNASPVVGSMYCPV